MHIHSDFAILDVKDGRHELAKRILAGNKQSVVVEITLDAVHSRDDGTSIEFSGSVSKLTLGNVVALATKGAA